MYVMGGPQGRLVFMRALPIAFLSLLSASVASAVSTRDDGKVKFVARQELSNVSGNALTAVVVSYPPGGKSPRHHHAGSLFAYVLSGEVRSQNSATGPVRTYTAGESFYEPPGSEHLISENGSSTKTATLLAVFVAPEGATLTTYNK